MEFDLFVGRLHPLVVHLPIGFFILTILFEVISLVRNSASTWRMPILIALGAGILSAVFSVTTGLLLAGDGGYEEEMLSRHKWVGISLLLFSILLFALKLKIQDYDRRRGLVLMLVFFSFISITGHLGGNLTHGEGYLVEYAPGFVQKLAGLGRNNDTGIEGLNPDSAMVYQHFVRPMFEAKCVQCHGEAKQSGSLDLSHYAALFELAESGTPVQAGSHQSSELFRRVSLSPSSTKFMPPKGSPLSYTELMILKYWINQGADSLAGFNFEQMDEELVQLMIREYDLDFHPKPYYEKVQLDPIDDGVFDDLENAGLIANYLSENNFLLDVRFSGEEVTQNTITALSAVADRVTFLKMADCGLTDALVQQFPDLPHPTHLDIHGNEVSDSSVEVLQGYRNLSVLNMYGTSITDTGLEALKNHAALARLYVWQTGITQEAINAASSDRLEVIGAYQ